MKRPSSPSTPSTSSMSFSQREHQCVTSSILHQPILAATRTSPSVACDHYWDRDNTIQKAALSFEWNTCNGYWTTPRPSIPTFCISRYHQNPRKLTSREDALPNCALFETGRSLRVSGVVMCSICRPWTYRSTALIEDLEPMSSAENVSPPAMSSGHAETAAGRELKGKHPHLLLAYIQFRKTLHTPRRLLIPWVALHQL